MEIVDLEDQHRVKPRRIKQEVEDKILTTSVRQTTIEESD